MLRRLSFFLLIYSLGCDNDRIRVKPDDPDLLPRLSSADTLDMHLVRRLSHFLGVARAADSSSLSALITADFKVIDTRASLKRSPGGHAVWDEITYWQVLAGHLSKRLDPEYSTFSADVAQYSARVYAGGSTNDIWSTWSYRDGAWRPVEVAITPHLRDSQSVVRNRSIYPRRPR